MSELMDSIMAVVCIVLHHKLRIWDGQKIISNIIGNTTMNYLVGSRSVVNYTYMYVLYGSNKVTCSSQIDRVVQLYTLYTAIMNIIVHRLTRYNNPQQTQMFEPVLSSLHKENSIKCTCM